MRIVKLTDQVLLGLARTGDFRNKFSAFKQLYDSLGARGCGHCKNRRRQSVILPALKQSIIGNPALITAIKQQLHADSLIIFVKQGNMVAKKDL